MDKGINKIYSQEEFKNLIYVTGEKYQKILKFYGVDFEKDKVLSIIKKSDDTCISKCIDRWIHNDLLVTIEYKKYNTSNANKVIYDDLIISIENKKIINKIICHDKDIIIDEYHSIIADVEYINGEKETFELHEKSEKQYVDILAVFKEMIK